MHWTEQAMKACLDGTFTRLTFSAAFGTRAVTKAVDRDWIPDYDAPVKREQTGAANRSPRRLYTAEEDSKILELRAQKVPMLQIARMLDRDPKSLTTRVARMRGVLA